MSDAAASGAEGASLTGKSRNGATPSAIALAKRLGLRHVTTDALSIRRRRRGRGWAYIRVDGRPIQDARVVRRLARLAVPPAYKDVVYAADPAAHLQAIGRDAAGRLQYRYHPQWDHVREMRKARASLGSRMRCPRSEGASASISRRTLKPGSSRARR